MCRPTAHRLTLVADIDRESLMAPPQVVQVLSKKPGANVGLVRDYIIRKCEANRQLTVEVRALSVCRRLAPPLCLLVGAD